MALDRSVKTALIMPADLEWRIGASACHCHSAMRAARDIRGNGAEHKARDTSLLTSSDNNVVNLLFIRVLDNAGISLATGDNNLLDGFDARTARLLGRQLHDLFRLFIFIRVKKRSPDASKRHIHKGDNQFCSGVTR